MYDIQVKGHYSTVWNDLFEFPESYLTPSTGQSTAISFQFSNPYFIGGPPPLYANGLTLLYSSIMLTVPYGGQVDFQVRAGIGHGYTTGLDQWLFNGQLSSWSNIQTITIPNNTTSTVTSPTPTSTPTPTPTPSPTPTVPELSWLVILPLLVGLLSVAVTLKFRRRKNQATVSSQGHVLS